MSIGMHSAGWSPPLLPLRTTLREALSSKSALRVPPCRPKPLGSARPDELLEAGPPGAGDDGSSLHATNSLCTLSSTGRRWETVASQTSTGLTPPGLELGSDPAPFLSRDPWTPF